MHTSLTALLFAAQAEIACAPVDAMAVSGDYLLPTTGIQAAYYGVFLTTVAFMLLAFIGRGERVYLYFAIHVAMLGLTMAGWGGRLIELGLPGWSSNRLPPVFIALFFLFGACFYQRLLETRTHTPRWHALLHLASWLVLPPALLGVLEPVTGNRLFGVTGLVWLLGVTGAAVSRARSGYAPAASVLVGMCLLFVAILLKAVEVLGMPLVSPDLSTFLIRIGAICCPAALIFGMAQRVRLLGEEHDRAVQLAGADRDLVRLRTRFDALTGLPNRDKFSEDLADRMRRAEPAANAFAVVILGLERFHTVAQALGHDVSDQVLRRIAERLNSRRQQGEVAARLGPDTFGLLVPRYSAGTPIGALVDRCWEFAETIGDPIPEAEGVSVSVCLGVALYPEHGSSADTLIRAAEAAFYRARDLGSGALEVYRPELLGSVSRELRLRRDLRATLERKAFELHYQPLIHLRTGRVFSVEALLRWRNGGAYVSPDVFIPLAESSDLIGPISEWVLETACRQMAQWRRRGIPIHHVAVNISARQFGEPGLVDMVKAALTRAGLPGDALEIEITEGALVENVESTRAVLQALRDLGVGVTVDDFGIGYSSLSYLRTLPVTGFKLDRSFLRGIPAEPQAVSVLSAVVTLGRELRLRMVVEGIETPMQHSLLLSKGVNVGQGFLFTRALPAEELESWIGQRGAQQTLEPVMVR